MDKKGLNKYDILLAFINSLLKNVNKEPIEDFKKFVDIEKNVLTSDDAMKSFNEHKINLLAVYDKHNSGYYRRNQVKYFILVFLRRALKDLNLKLVCKEKKIQVNNHSTASYLYSIIDN